MKGLQLRLIREGDDLQALTELIHRAYARLAGMGLNYTATYQTEADTRRRIGRGECWLAELAGRTVGTLTLKPPGRGQGCRWYEREDVAVLNQFAVEPALQGRGIGSALMTRLEARAHELGASEIALDTADVATHLVAWYVKRGYRFVEHTHWPGKTYRSVILSKHLLASTATHDDSLSY